MADVVLYFCISGLSAKIPKKGLVLSTSLFGTLNNVGLQRTSGGTKWVAVVEKGDFGELIISNQLGTEGQTDVKVPHQRIYPKLHRIP